MLHHPPRRIDALDREQRGVAIRVGEVDVASYGDEVGEQREVVV
jgi:hypothetical protein